MQFQYTSGPQAIVRWAAIVNAQLWAGPAEVIKALSEAAQKAIASHNTSVQTDISASPPGSLGSSGNNHAETDDSDEEDDDADDANSDIVEEDDDDDRKGRKHSVVSVSTTISTKTEAISPQPALRPTLSRGSTDPDEDDDDEEEDPEAMLEALGPPPFYRSLLLLAEMSSKNNLFGPEYVSTCVKQARANKDFVMGFFAQRSLNSEKEDNFITMTPGVQLAAGGDALVSNTILHARSLGTLAVM